MHEALILLVALLVASALLAVPALQADEAVIRVDAGRVLGRVSRHLTGACIEDVNHEIYGGIYSQMIFGESFQEPAPQAAIAGFTPYGGGWGVHEGIVRVEGLDGPKLVSEHPAFADGAVGVEVLFTDRAGENAGVIVRVSRPGVGADRFTGYEVSLDPGRQILRLGRHRNNWEHIRDVPCEVAVGRWIPLEVRLAGTLLEVLVDGEVVLRHDDGANALPAGTVGLRPWHREVSYRNLWVKRDESTAALPFVQSEEVPAVSGMWLPLHRGSAVGRYALVTERPFAGAQSQRLSFESGEGEWGIENQGLNRWGMHFVEGKRYEGCVWARAERPATLYASLESRDGSRVLAETPLRVAGGDWQRLDFTLAPGAGVGAGRFALRLKSPGEVDLGYAYLQPGAWGRFKGLPVRRDVAEALIAQGITVLRYGGSMVNHPEYRWKKMVGPRDRRPPYRGFWYPYSTNGWGIPDFMAFCEAAGFEYIPAFHMGESPEDMADFIEYARGSEESEWGRKRAADGHPKPFRLRYVQLGNEERVDEEYFARFRPMAEAIWAKDPDVVLVVGDFFYSRKITDPFAFEGGAVNTLAAHRKILELAKAHDREVWFDIHIGTEAPPAPGDLAGPFSFIEQLGKLCPGARYQVAIFEFNAGNHAQKRGLSNALAINAIERDGRIPVATSANCLQPDGQNDNDWNQGLLFLNPAQVWLQPPGYVTQMVSNSYQPLRVESNAEGGLDVAAARSEDGKTLVLRVVNPGERAVSAQIRLAGFAPGRRPAEVTELAGPLEALNTAADPSAIVPHRSEWEHGTRDGLASRTFAPHSFTVIRFRGSHG